MALGDTNGRLVEQARRVAEIKPGGRVSSNGESPMEERSALRQNITGIRSSRSKASNRHRFTCKLTIEGESTETLYWTMIPRAGYSLERGAISSTIRSTIRSACL